ncbi:MAG: DUF169 domain-containing protein [Patescibacteria group bacterium]
MSNLKKLEQKYLRLIKGKGLPVGVKMLTPEEELPKSVANPKGNMALCQVLKEAAVYKKKRAVSVENMGGCVIGSRVLGFEEVSENLKNRWVEGFAYQEEIFDELMEQTEKFPLDKYQAAVFAPLGEFQDLGWEPDAVVMVVNSSQAYLLTMGVFDKTGKKCSPRINGHAACEIVVPVVEEGNPWLTVPCGGARSIASSQDDELWVGLTVSDLEKALERVEETGLGYPPPVEQMPITEANPQHPLTGLINRQD